jgi:hypothetical protein
MVQKAVPCSEVIMIKTKALVEVPKTREVEESYTVMEKRKGKRPKVTWIKEIVQEAYEQKEPVLKVRKVPRRVKRLKESDDIKEFSVDTTKVVPVEAYRIDEVQGIKVIEIEEWEDMELIEQRISGQQRVLTGRQQEREVDVRSEARKLGTKIFPADAAELQGLAEDEGPAGPADNSTAGLHESITDYDPDQFSFSGHEEARGPLEMFDLEVGTNEHFAVRNRSVETLSLAGWSVHEEASGNVYRFPEDVVLGPGQHIKVFSGPRANAQRSETRSGLVWTTRQVWNSSGDRASLRSAKNETMHLLIFAGAFRDLHDSIREDAYEAYNPRFAANQR